MTGDIDFFVSLDKANQQALRKVLSDFGFASTLPKAGEDVIKPEKILMLGRQPQRIDILSTLSDVKFEEAWEARIEVVLDGLSVNIICLSHLITNKIASGRPKDLADVEVLKKFSAINKEK